MRTGNCRYNLAVVFTVIFASLALGGCSPLQQEARKRFFWPPPPEESKIEYVNYYVSTEDLLRGVDNRWQDMVFGKLAPQRLFSDPYSVASNGKGRIYVADFACRCVKVIDLVQHQMRFLPNFAGLPQKVIVDASGEVWVLDSASKSALRYDAEEKLLAEIKFDELQRPTSLAVDRQRNRLYVVDTPAHVIRVFDLAGQSVATIGGRGNRVGEFNFPTDIDLDSEQNLFVIDAMNARIQVFDAQGGFIRAFGERGTSLGSFSLPKGISVSPSGLVYVTDGRLSKVVVFNRQGEFLMMFGGHEVFDGKKITPGGMNMPIGIDADARETIWIVDLFSSLLHEYQFLTPDYLLQHPIKPEEVFVPELGAIDPEPVPAAVYR